MTNRSSNQGDELLDTTRYELAKSNLARHAWTKATELYRSLLKFSAKSETAKQCHCAYPKNVNRCVFKTVLFS